MSKQVKECSPPPTEDVEWIVTWPVEWILKGGATMLMSGCAGAIARTAWQAHQQVKGAPAFGSCRVRRVEKETKNGA